MSVAARGTRVAIDRRAVAAGTVVVVVLTAGLVAAAVHFHHADPTTGPTAASLDEAFFAFWAGALGLALGAAFASAISRTRPLAGAMLATGLGCLLLLPLFILRIGNPAWVDVVFALVFMALVGGVFGLAGAVAGDLGRSAWLRSRAPRRPAS